MNKYTSRTLAALALTLAFGMVQAQDNGSYDDGAYVQDPPDRAARLSYIRGDVSMQPAGEDEWAPALLNRPLTTGDKLWTERNARAEIDVGESAVRLDSETGFSFLNVDDDTIQMRMTAGVISLTVRELDGNDHIEIDTPNMALSILRPGTYRVEVNDAGDATTVKISEGEAEAEGPSQNVIVHAQQAVTFRGYDNLVADWGRLGAPDEFDSWSLERDRYDNRATTSRSAQYVSPDVTGYEDLDDNGSWSSEPEYGYVWTPARVAVDWSPYRYGRWVWVGPWGWTWIDDAPWGYAPFHYGRWAHVRERWCWVPGPRHVRAVYAPALVGWVGGGRLAWFPLGPREVYVPGRRFSHRYVERVNVTNTVIVNRTVITNVYDHRDRNYTYRNRNAPGGVTAVSRDTFTSAGRIGDRRVRFSEAEMARNPSSGEAPQIAPVRESRLGGATRVNVRPPPQTVVNRQVIVKRDPPSAAAHFARNRGGEDRARAPSERFDRTPDRSSERNRPDRPSAETNLRTQPSVSEPRPVAERPREDRPARDDRPREDWQSRQREQPIWREQPEVPQQRQPQDEQQRLQREQQQERERYQRQQQNSEHQAEARQAQERERNNERQRNEQHQQEQRQQEQRQQEQRQQQQNRAEAKRQTEEKPRRQKNDDDNPRTQRD